MENSNAIWRLGAKDMAANEGSFRESALRFVQRIGEMLDKSWQQTQAEQPQPQKQLQHNPWLLSKRLQAGAAESHTHGATDMQPPGMSYSEENQQRLLCTLDQGHPPSQQRSERQRCDERVHRGTRHKFQQQRQAIGHRTLTQQHVQQQSGRIPAERRVGCAILKSHDAVPSTERTGTQSVPMAPFDINSYPPTVAAAATTLTPETGRTATPWQGSEAYLSRDLYVSEELPIIYAHSVAVQQPLPVGRLIPQNVRPPQCKAAAGLGPARMPPMLTGSPFFHRAPSSPQCPAVSPQTPALAALPQPFVMCEESPARSAVCPRRSSRPLPGSSLLQDFPASGATVQSVDPVGGVDSGEVVSGLIQKNIGSCVTDASAVDASNPYTAAENLDSLSVTATTARTSLPARVSVALARPSLHVTSATAIPCISCATTSPETLGPAPCTALARKEAAPVSDATADALPSTPQSALLTDDEDERPQEGPDTVQQSMLEGKPEPQSEKVAQRKSLKIVTVPHQHAAFYNYTVATLKKRLEESGQLRAICPSGICLHEQLSSQQQPAFFAMLEEVNKNAADAASLSKRWQERYTTNCVGLPAAAAAKLKERQQKKESGIGLPSHSLNDASRRTLSTTASHTTCEQEGRLRWLEKTTAAEGPSSTAVSHSTEQRVPVVDKSMGDKQPRDQSACATVSAAPRNISVASTSPATRSTSLERPITLDDLVIKPGPPPSAAWAISGLSPTSTATAYPGQLQQLEQQAHADIQALSVGAVSPTAAAVEYQGGFSNGTKLRQHQQQQHAYDEVPLQYMDTASTLAGKQDPLVYVSGEAAGFYTPGGLPYGQHNEETGETTSSESGAERVYVLQQQLKAKEKKVKHLEKMLAQHRAAYLATRPFATKPLRGGPGRATGNSRQDYGHSRGSSVSGSSRGDLLAAGLEQHEREQSETRSSSRASAAVPATKAERGGDGAAAGTKTNYRGKHEKADLDAQVRRFLSSKTPLPMGEVLRQVKRGVYLFGDTKALVTKERSGKIVCEVLQHGGDVSDFAEEYKGKRLSLDRFWRLVCGRGLCRLS